MLTHNSRRIHIDDLIAQYGAADMGADVANTIDLSQLVAHAAGNAAHLGLRRAGHGFQVNQHAELFELRQRRGA